MVSRTAAASIRVSRDTERRCQRRPFSASSGEGGPSTSTLVNSMTPGMNQIAVATQDAT